MPMYEYSCPECKTEIEIIQSIGAEAPTCKVCGTTLKRLISLTSFKLIGDGWADTGYAKGKKR